jgi:hypothetical protein
MESEKIKYYKSKSGRIIASLPNGELIIGSLSIIILIQIKSNHLLFNILLIKL